MNNVNLNCPKIITYFLPQYHEVPENNQWWGKGFTEWTNVKKAKTVYRGQIQPKIPLNDNYYNLLDKKTVEWQTALSQKYGIYGFCYFYYYFKNGKKVLGKPAENLLKWKDINQRFCFFWANVEWRRTWSSIKNQASTNWSPSDNCHTDNGLLLEQDYGDEKDWVKHFEYLIQFFKDERYIKIDGKPLFAIYYVSYIPHAYEMFKLWDSLAKKNGLPGIYILSVNESIDNEYVNGIIHYGGGQVNRSFVYKMIDKKYRILNKISKILLKKEFPIVIDYKKYWDFILKDKPYGTVANIPGGTVKYDETPRRGPRSLCLSNDSPDIFYDCFLSQLRRASSVFNSEFLFLDAWNEWGEGNYLEPDVENGYGYLEALKKALDDF